MAMTVLALACAYVNRGLRRSKGIVIIAAYIAFAGILLTNAYWLDPQKAWPVSSSY
jgi:hypothetical protein